MEGRPHRREDWPAPEGLRRGTERRQAAAPREERDQARLILASARAAAALRARESPSRVPRRLLTACCASDVLRIYAPVTPWPTPQLLTLFDVFVTLLGGVAKPKGPLYARYFYLLDRLSITQAFVLMIDLKTDDLMLQLFDTLFASIREVRARPPPPSPEARRSRTLPPSGPPLASGSRPRARLGASGGPRRAARAPRRRRRACTRCASRRACSTSWSA